MFVCCCRTGAAQGQDRPCFAAAPRTRADQEAGARFDTRGSGGEVSPPRGSRSEAAWEDPQSGRRRWVTWFAEVPEPHMPSGTSTSGARQSAPLKPGLAAGESLGAMKVNLLAPGREERAVDALAAQERLDLATLGACGGLSNDPQLLGSREGPPPARLRLDFNGEATRAGRSVGRRGGGGRIDRSEMGGLGHGSGPFSALCTQITRRRLSHSTLAQRAAPAADNAVGAETSGDGHPAVARAARAP